MVFKCYHTLLNCNRLKRGRASPLWSFRENPNFQYYALILAPSGGGGGGTPTQIRWNVLEVRLYSERLQHIVMTKNLEVTRVLIKMGLKRCSRQNILDPHYRIMQPSISYSPQHHRPQNNSWPPDKFRTKLPRQAKTSYQTYCKTRNFWPWNFSPVNLETIF